MDMSNFRPELHVAQQRRRDKLRIQHTSIPEQHHLETCTNNLEQFSVHQGVLTPEFMQLRNNFRYDNISYDPAVITSEMLNVMATSQAVLVDKNAMMVHQDHSTTIDRPDKAIASEDASFANLSHALSSTLNHSAKVRGDPHNCSSTAWKSFGSQQNSAWVTNYTCGSAGIESNTSQMFVGEGFSGAMKMINASASTVDLKPSYFGCNDVQSSLTNPSSEISSQNSQKHYGNMHINSPSFCQNTLQDVVTSATLGNPEVKMVSFAPQNIKEMGRGSWTDAGNELVLLPGYSDPSSRTHLSYSTGLVSRPVEGCHQWIGESNFPASKNSERDPRTVANDFSSTQALSLSLSSAPMPKMNVDHDAERNHFSGRDGCSGDIPDSRSLKSNHVCTVDPKPSIGDKFMVYSRPDMVGTSTFNHRNVGPLGPFTGYATILRCSKFLRPAQELLDESCNITNPKFIRPTESSILAEEIRVSSDAINADEPEFRAKTVDSGGSSSAFCTNDKSQEAGGLSSSNALFHPDYLMKKAMLLYMQEEVCRRHKQYHQQMQMVVSSFESVAGLSSAAPYISLALKTISRHFRCLRDAIVDQLRNTRKALGEDFLSPTTGTSNSKGDTSTSRLKFIDPSFQKLKAGGGSMGFLEPQHVWRPQRGLPERAVAVLRAWLFDHFLHPYPTDADKHILATQTGLTKNQVSNWFINARVRVWKPMVEEIHTLETKGQAASVSNAGRTDNEKPHTEGARGQHISQQLNNLSSTSGIPDGQIECSDIGSSSSAGIRLNTDMWNPDKRSRFECHSPTNMEGSLVSFMPYQRSGIEIGSIGAVSLTLGLRQSAEGAQQQQPQHQFLQHLGGHIIHDFVG